MHSATGEKMKVTYAENDLKKNLKTDLKINIVAKSNGFVID